EDEPQGQQELGDETEQQKIGVDILGKGGGHEIEKAESQVANPGQQEDQSKQSWQECRPHNECAEEKDAGTEKYKADLEGLGVEPECGERYRLRVCLAKGSKLD